MITQLSWEITGNPTQWGIAFPQLLVYAYVKKVKAAEEP